MNAIPKISGKTVGIIIAMVLIIGCLLSLSFWYSWSGIIPAIASFGGMVVWIGLWVEKEADEDAKNEEHLTDAIRAKAKLGWRVLMWGITVEIATGSALATFDIVQASKNDPWNGNISDISARAYFEVRGGGSDIPKPAGSTHVAYLELCENDKFARIGLGAPSAYLGFFSALDADSFERYGAVLLPGQIVPKKSYSLDFHSIGAVAMAPDSQIKVKEINKAQIARLNLRFLPENSEILGGSVEVVIHSDRGNIRKVFRIFPQMDTNQTDFGADPAYAIFGTNISRSPKL